MLDSLLANRLPAFIAILLGLASNTVDAAVTGGFDQVVGPFLAKHCLRCHGEQEQAAKLRLDQLPQVFADLTASAKWTEVLDRINAGEMPPPDEPQPSAKQLERVTGWLAEELRQSAAHRQSTGGQVVLRRLNRTEYRNTIRDLLGIDFPTDEQFPEDPPAHGFDNIGAALHVSPLLIEKYMAAARRIVDRALAEPVEPQRHRWRFEVDQASGGPNQPFEKSMQFTDLLGDRDVTGLLNGGRNETRDGSVVVTGEGWQASVGFRAIRDYQPRGEYLVRVRATGIVPNRRKVIESAERIWRKRNGMNQAHRRHFEQSSFYDYGPPRMKVIDWQSRAVLGVVDVPPGESRVYEFRGKFPGGLSVSVGNIYHIPGSHANHWFRRTKDFASPRLLVDWVEVEGPMPDRAAAEAHRRVLSAFGNQPSGRDETQRARVILREFMTRAWRRPITDAEVTAKLALFTSSRSAKPSFEEALKPPLIAVLCSPHFLYLAEPRSGNARGRVLAEFRQFRSRDGRAITARVLMRLGERVAIELDSGKRHTVAVDAFSDVDQEYISGLTDEQLPFRHLTDRRGRQLTARVVGLSGSDVLVERTDGQQVTIPITILSAKDQAYARGRGVAIGSGEQRRPRLTDYQLASRLSYFLWSSMPDDELFQLAARGELNDAEVLRQQVDRMLADPKSQQFVKNFAGQWLGLRNVGTNPPSRNLFPRFDGHLQESMIRESEAFFAEILHHDLTVMNFIKSDFVTINERLGRFYGIAGVKGDEIRRVKVPGDVPRGGVMTQGSILTVTSNGTRTVPVWRGVWILENLLNDPPPPPPPNAGEIPQPTTRQRPTTIRAKMEVHRRNPACASCHNKIDPLGFALENFRGDGGWATQEANGWNGSIRGDDPVIDASGRLPDGRRFSGVRELQQLLLGDEDRFLNCLAEKLATYALGRGIEFSDRPWLDELVANMKTNGRTLRGLIKDIVTNDQFRSK